MNLSPESDSILAGASFPEWKETCATLHMWTQIVGKDSPGAFSVDQSFLARHALSHRARLDHFAHSFSDSRVFQIDFDFVDHVLRIEKIDGRKRSSAWSRNPSPSFYGEVMGALARARFAGQNQHDAERGRSRHSVRSER